MHERVEVEAGRRGIERVAWIEENLIPGQTKVPACTIIARLDQCHTAPEAGSEQCSQRQSSALPLG